MGRLRTRHNSMPDSVYCGVNTYDFTPPYGNGPWTNPMEQNRLTYGARQSDEVCVDMLHPGPPYRSGGPLCIWRVYTDFHLLRGSIDSIQSYRRYEGGFCCSQNLLSHLTFTSANLAKLGDFGNVDSYGATGWNKFRPTRSDAGLAEFLGEIKEVPRMLQTTAKGFHNLWKSMGGSPTGFSPKAVADHWLNTQFGWVPFLNELVSFYKATQGLDKRVKQLRRDNNQWVRRGGTVAVSSDSETISESETSHIHYPTLATQHYAGPPYGSHIIKRSIQRNVWFEGRYKYWIPSLEDGAWPAGVIARVFGALPSPSLVWELTPWSWLIDWCSNAGDCIANMSSIMYDNLVAKYAYIMGTTREEVIATSTSNLKVGPHTASWTASLTAKQRGGASPFGFGLTPGEFSPRQWSILAALGLTRLGS
jgi:hypothetical protein